MRGDLFGRHLDLAPLRGRRRGLVPCIFHNDRRPSLSVDLDQGVFHCFGCGAGGGVKRFAELVGEALPRPRPERRRSALEQARVEVLAEAQRQQKKLEPYRPLLQAADFIRSRFHFADRARWTATALGPSERVWGLLAGAARLEIGALALEAAVDEILSGGRIV